MWRTFVRLLFPCQRTNQLLKPDQDLFPVTRGTADMAARCCVGSRGLPFCQLLCDRLAPRGGIEHALKHVPRSVISWRKSAFFFMEVSGNEESEAVN